MRFAEGEVNLGGSALRVKVGKRGRALVGTATVGSIEQYPAKELICLGQLVIDAGHDVGRISPRTLAGLARAKAQPA